MKFQLNPNLLQLFSLVAAILAIAAIVSMNYVDNIVNITLYTYGLQFDSEWAIPYWTFFRLTLALLGCIAGLNIFSVFYFVLSHRTLRARAIASTLRKAPILKKKYEEVEEKEEEKEDYVEVAAILPMVCSKCGKAFTQPLCMFDFRSGKPRLVSVCPYCNNVLAVAGNSKTI